MLSGQQEQEQEQEQEEQLLQLLGRVLRPSSSSQLQQASSELEGLRRAPSCELLLLRLLERAVQAGEEAVGAGEAVLLAQTLRWRLAHMPVQQLGAVLSQTTLLLRAAECASLSRAVRENVYLSLATLLVRQGALHSSSRPLSLFIEHHNENLSAISIARIIKHIPEVASQAYVYKGTTDDVMPSATMTMCAMLLGEIPVVMDALDAVLSEVLSTFNVCEVSLPSHPDRDSFLQKEILYTLILDVILTALSWINLFSTVLEYFEDNGRDQDALNIFWSSECDDLWIQCKVVILSLSFMRETLVPSPSFENIFVEGNTHRMYNLCSEVVFALLQKRWISMDVHFTVHSTILSVVSTLIRNVSDFYRSMLASIRESPADHGNLLTVIKEIADQFNSSFLGIAISVISTDCIWKAFLLFLQNLNSKYLSLSDFEALFPHWKDLFIGLLSFMDVFNMNFCECDGVEENCPFAALCCSQEVMYDVAETHFCVRKIGLQVFQPLLPLWRGLLEDEDQSDPQSLELSRFVQSIFVENMSGSEIILRAVTQLLFSTRLVDHSCVMIQKLITDGSCFEFAQSCYSCCWETDCGEELNVFRKHFRDALRSFGKSSSLLFYSVLYSRSPVIANCDKFRHAKGCPEVRFLWQSAAFPIWLCDMSVTEISKLREVLAGREYISGAKLLNLETILHSTSAVLSGEGARAMSILEISPLNPQLSADMPEMMSACNVEKAAVFYRFITEVCQLSHDLMTPKFPLFAFASPIIRLVDVILIDLYEPFISYVGVTSCVDFNEANLHALTIAICQILLQSIYIAEEFDERSVHFSDFSQLHFIGASLPFRIKQDHIGCVSLIKFSQLLNKFFIHRDADQLFKEIVSNQRISMVLPNLLSHNQQSDCFEDEITFSFTSCLYCESLPNAYRLFGSRDKNSDDIMLLWMKCYIHNLVSLVVPSDGRLVTSCLSWKSMLLLQESTVYMLESVSFVLFKGELDLSLSGADLTSFSPQNISLGGCFYWYFPMILPVVMLLLHTTLPTSEFEGIFDEVISLCGCVSETHRTKWRVKSKLVLLEIRTMFEENYAMFFGTIEANNIKTTHSEAFFDILAKLISNIVKQSLSRLQHVSDENNLLRSYCYFCYEIYSIVSLGTRCILPLCRNILDSVQYSSDNEFIFFNTMKGVTMLVDACSASIIPPRYLKRNSDQFCISSFGQSLAAELNEPSCIKSCCSSTTPDLPPNNLVVSLFEEIYDMAAGIVDIHGAGVQEICQESHWVGLIGSINSVINIVRTLSHWPYNCGNSIRFLEGIFNSLSTKCFHILGWNDVACELASSVEIPMLFYSTLISFWIHCLKYLRNDVPFETMGCVVPQVSLEHITSIFRFSLVAANEVFGERKSNSTAKDVQVFLLHFVEVSSLCLGNFPNLVTPHSLNSEGLVHPTCLNSLQCSEAPCGDFSLVEKLCDSGDGLRMVQILSLIYRDSHCPPTVKEILFRLFIKFILTFGSALSAEFLKLSSFASVSDTIISHSLLGQWKKLKNTIKTLSK